MRSHPAVVANFPGVGIVRAMNRRLLLLKMGAFFLGAICAVPVSAAENMRASTPETKKEIVAVIEAQLAAFRKGDVVKAYGYAAEELRAQKPLPAFTTIVQTNYPEIWQSTRAEFGIARDDGAKASVTVQVYAKETEAAYDFTLVKERGGWRIHGVLRHAPKKAGKA